MKKSILLLTLLATAMLLNAQPKGLPSQPRGASAQPSMEGLNQLTLDINPIDSIEAIHINQYIEKQKLDRSFFGTVGLAVLNTLVTQSSGLAIDGVMQLTQISKQHKSEWERMIKNECSYVDSLTYVDNLTDFYSKGSSNGALDPADFNFNGFTLCAQRDGKDVLRFYCHVDTSQEGLDEIINHSKFHLVLDSMYFYPYRCHLPNLTANQICPEKGKQYDRRTSFSFKERNNLTVCINFAITSSWYNQAIMLSKDVELGRFSIEVPIRENRLTDSVFVYKNGDPDMSPMSIAGDCFIVPRSYMPLTGGTPHWGTGEYNVKVTLSERCNIAESISKDWQKDYRRIKRMQKDQKFWPKVGSYCIQNGTNLIRYSLNAASSAAIDQWEWINQAGGSRGSGGASGMNGGAMPNHP